MMQSITWGRPPDVTPGRPPPVAPDHGGRPPVPRVPGRRPSSPLTPELVSPPELCLLITLHHDQGITWLVLDTTPAVVQSIPVASGDRKPNNTEIIDLLEI